MEFKEKCFDHQLETFNKIKDLDSYALFWEMGLGKTKTLIDVLRYKFEKHGEGKVLILCPKIVIDSWVEQLEKHSYMADLAEPLIGSKKERMEIFKKSKNLIFITNYDSLNTPDKVNGPDPFTQMLLDENWFMIIADEMHRIKNHTSQRGKVLTALGVQARFRFGATGTPYLRNHLDLFNQFKFLDKGLLFGRVFSQYRFRYFIDKNASWRSKQQYFPNWEMNPRMEEELKIKIASISDRRLKKDCLDIQDPLFEKIILKPGKEQAKAYKEMLNELVYYVKSAKEHVVAQNVLTKALRLLQISGGFMKTESGAIIRFKDNPKLDAVEDKVRDIVEQGKKVIVSSIFKEEIKMIKERMIDLNPAEIHGGASEKDKFINEQSCKLLIAHPHSLIGINGLTIASDLLYYSNNFSYEDRNQSMGRIHRPEQRNICTYYDYIITEADQLALDNNMNKEASASRLLDFIKNTIRYTTKNS